MFAMISVLLWSTVASVFKISLRYLTPVELLFYAACFSCAVLFVALVAQHKLHLLRNLGWRVWKTSILFGLLSPFGYYLILLKAYDLLPAQQAQPLNYTWALTLTYLSVPLLGQRLRPLDIIAGLVCYSGVFVIATRGQIMDFHFSDPVGVGLALGSTLIWALYWIASTRDQRDPVAGLLLNFLFGLPVIALICAFTSGFAIPDPDALFGAAYVGTFEMGVSYVLWLSALKLATHTASLSNLIFISPFLSLVFIHVLVGEAILSSTYAGLVLIITGLILQRIRPVRARALTGNR